MSLSEMCWIDGITGSIVVIFGILFGIFFFYDGTRKDAKLLKLLGMICIFAGLLYLGLFLDFITILLTGSNFPNDRGQIAIMSYIWFPITMSLAVYVATYVQYPKKAKYFMLPFVFFGALFYLAIFLDPFGTFYFGFYEKHTPRLIDYNINLSSRAGKILASFLLTIIIVYVGGLIYQAFQLPSVVRKKFFILAIGALGFGISGSLEGLTQPGLEIILIRIFYLSCFWLIYIGLRPSENYEDNFPLKHSTSRFIKKLGLDLTRPADLTEQDVAFYREQTICLVCKNYLSGFTSVFICPKCRALYCANCANALSSLENECWSCDDPIDIKKPVKKIDKKEEEAKMSIEPSKDPHKKEIPKK